MIVYEQPSNEELRACLRIEQLLRQVEKYQSAPSAFTHRNTVVNLLTILNIVDRPDIKLKLAKRLDQQMGSLQSHLEAPNIDHTFLETLIAQLGDVKYALLTHQGKLCQNLRESELIKQTSPYAAQIGSGFSFDTPLFHYFMSQSSAVRGKQIELWLQEFEFLKETTRLLLDTTRQNAQPSHENTKNGFFQKSLDPALDYQLFRVQIPEGVTAYPKISVGKQHINIHFYDATRDDKPTPYASSIHFQLTCCAVSKNSFERAR